MQNHNQKTSALFSDATIEELLNASGGSLILDAMSRLGVKLQVNNEPVYLPELSPGYLVCLKDSLIIGVSGMTYCKPLGAKPELVFHNAKSTKTSPIEKPSSTLVPVEICRRNAGLPGSKFDSESYFKQLNTRSLGHLLLYVPVCETTMSIAKSLSVAFPDSDGILVVAGCQTVGKGRSGNDWLSPDGCAMFSFSFNIPTDSELGRSLGFIQHIMAVSIADAVSSLLVDEYPACFISLNFS